MKTIGFVKGKGNINCLTNYTYIDHPDIDLFAEPNLYYRLKQFDFDEKFDFSNIISISNPTAVDEFSIYPNPAGKNVFVTIPIQNQQQSEICFYDISGKRVKTVLLEPNQNNLEIPVSDLQHGLYFIKLMREDAAVKTLKLVIE